MSIRSTPSFYITAWLGYSFAIYTWFLLFRSSSFLWVILGLSLLIIFRCITKGPSSVHQSLTFPGITFPLSRIIIRSSSFLYFSASMYGLIDIILELPLYDKSFMLLPLLISACFLGGASITLAQID